MPPPTSRSICAATSRSNCGTARVQAGLASCTLKPDPLLPPSTSSTTPAASQPSRAAGARPSYFPGPSAIGRFLLKRLARDHQLTDLVDGALQMLDRAQDDQGVGAALEHKDAELFVDLSEPPGDLIQGCVSHAAAPSSAPRPCRQQPLPG